MQEPTGFHPLQRYDLEPTPQPEASDIIEGVTAVLEVAVELAQPGRTAARTLTVLSRLMAAADGHVTPDELLASLRRLVQDWRSS